MTVIEAIEYLWKNYEEIDPSYQYAPLLEKIISEPPAEVLEILMESLPGDYAPSRTTEDWQADVEAAEGPKNAALTIIDWLEAKVQDQAEARALKEYMSQGPDKGVYNSSPTSPT